MVYNSAEDSLSSNSLLQNICLLNLFYTTSSGHLDKGEESIRAANFLVLQQTLYYGYYYKVPLRPSTLTK